jgi:hypothetical protein
VIQGLTVGLGANAVAGNTAVGISALSAATLSGASNVAVGSYSLLSNTSGAANIGIGPGALQTTTTGSYNTAIGSSSLSTNISGANNVALGVVALQLSTGSTNLALGYNAGSALTTGSNNTIIGSVAGTAGLSDTVIIAAGSAERMRIDSSGNVGIGTTTPQGKIDSAVSFGTLPNVNYLAKSGDTAQGLKSGYSFESTFVGTGDNGPRRSADIWSGYSIGAWGTEYLAFGVGIGGANDGGLITTERMRIDGAGTVSITATTEQSGTTGAMTVAGGVYVAKILTAIGGISGGTF